MICRICLILQTILLYVYGQSNLGRYRGIGMLAFPYGTTDVRSASVYPGLRIAGNKQEFRPQTIPSASLPGQRKNFYRQIAFNPLNHIFSSDFNIDIGDSFGYGYGIQGTNIFGLDVKNGYEAYASLPKLSADGSYQPFQNVFLWGSENDFKKYRGIASSMDIPIPKLNELFDWNQSLLMKFVPVIPGIEIAGSGGVPEVNDEAGNESTSTTEGDGSSSETLPAETASELATESLINLETGTIDGVTDTLFGTIFHEPSTEGGGESDQGAIEIEGPEVFDGFFDFPILTTDERFPFELEYANSPNDLHAHFAHLIPSVNVFGVPNDKLVERLLGNRANPTILG